jgi:hypothetical protein
VAELLGRFRNASSTAPLPSGNRRGRGVDVRYKSTTLI